ncbi:hypothetical protein O6H91_13G088500 [Diphasiastrum complanatum]|uniref:Uncharacterized protein n=1 Tax=Diphasiastrum complanatum TaxID=34168 RepID=A0ACC2BX02_DIPCM|nr:hypothetical protein O6H91_13G088500 [Diphasiastrum complanatum]
MSPAVFSSSPSSSSHPYSSFPESVGSKARRPKHHKRSQNSDSFTWKGQILQGLAILTVAGVVASSMLILMGWVEERRKPFCDTGVVPSTSDDCIICPEHGKCQGGRLECLLGFKRSGITCIEDKKIEKMADHLALLIEEHVCRVNGHSICNGSGAVWMTKADILNELRFEQLKEELALSNDEFWIVQDKAIERAMQKLDTTENFQGMVEFLCPSTIVHRFKPLGCHLQDWLLANWIIVCLLCVMIFLVVSLARRYWLRLRFLARAEEIYMQVKLSPFQLLTFLQLFACYKLCCVWPCQQVSISLLIQYYLIIEGDE